MESDDATEQAEVVVQRLEQLSGQLRQQALSIFGEDDEGEKDRPRHVPTTLPDEPRPCGWRGWHVRFCDRPMVSMIVGLSRKQAVSFGSISLSWKSGRARSDCTRRRLSERS